MVAIVDTKGRFSDRWIEYCKSRNIAYKIVNPYANNIIEELSECTIFLWHWHHADYKDQLFARQLLYALEQKEISVFPDFKTMWHFDDKLGQKYLLESIDAPLVKSYIFYSKEEAVQWTTATRFPVVFKLRGGAGSINVKLVHNKYQALGLIRKAFGKGFPLYNQTAIFNDTVSQFKKAKTVKNILRMLKWGGYVLFPPKSYRLFPKQKGYVYFQEFIPNNTFDIRIIVIDKKAFAIKRHTRKGDFRASGSGSISYAAKDIDIRCVQIGLEAAKKLHTQCVAYDFVFNEQNEPLIVEISYGFTMEAYDSCEGFWDRHLNWHPGRFNPQAWIIEALLKKNKPLNEPVSENRPSQTQDL
ncbi:ATP-grasp domain-containing protein [Niabella drilacis]|uniref:RimK-like ATP-grasp domain-containing protein n=1 Tax=Niabella drilacis (strain DSM 25811 / CCM 8410 / CCUG 62505 / LMG 26954 / E90) TaxID=1285928 RepID=A0A1G6QTQ4_NIADE|nr:hypothetical protein [Niabella drilacis]SDC95819.1 RimK-like ATP-grasp domain-containing protein [Niabella drilacis]